MHKPTVVISFDFELGWGASDSWHWRHREKLGVYTELRETFTQLVPLLKSLEIHSTWAIVGAMVDDRSISLDHLPDGYRESITKFCKESSDKSRDGRDLMDSLIQISNITEFATHTYTHPYPKYDGIKAKHYVADIEMSLEVLHRVTGSKPTTIVFPRDQSDFILEVEQDCRLDARLNPYYDVKSRGALVRAKDVALTLVKGVPESKVILGNNSTVHQTGSIYYNWIGGNYESIKKQLLKLNQTKLLQQLGEKESIYHIWLHPYNLSENGEVKSSFFEFLRILAKMRDLGTISIASMGDVSDRYNRAVREIA